MWLYHIQSDKSQRHRRKWICVFEIKNTFMYIFIEDIFFRVSWSWVDGFKFCGHSRVDSVAKISKIIMVERGESTNCLLFLNSFLWFWGFGFFCYTFWSLGGFPDKIFHFLPCLWERNYFEVNMKLLYSHYCRSWRNKIHCSS